MGYSWYLFFDCRYCSSTEMIMRSGKRNDINIRRAIHTLSDWGRRELHCNTEITHRAKKLLYTVFRPSPLVRGERLSERHGEEGRGCRQT